MMILKYIISKLPQNRIWYMVMVVYYVRNPTVYPTQLQRKYQGVIESKLVVDMTTGFRMEME